MQDELETLVTAVLADVDKAFAVGAVPCSRKELTRFSDLSEVAQLSEPLGGALWMASGPLREGIDALRQHLLPGGSLLVVSLPRGGPLSFFGRRPSGPNPRELAAQVCAVFLSAGWVEPRLLHESSRACVAAARLPTTFSPLDALF